MTVRPFKPLTEIPVTTAYEPSALAGLLDLIDIEQEITIWTRGFLMSGVGWCSVGPPIRFRGVLSSFTPSDAVSDEFPTGFAKVTITPTGA